MLLLFLLLLLLFYIYVPSMYFSLFCLFYFIGWFSLFSHSYGILISLTSFHSYSYNTLLLVFSLLFFKFRLYISFHIIVDSIHTQHPSLVLIHFTIFLSFITVVVNFILSHTTPSFYPLLSLYLTNEPSISALTFVVSSHYFSL